MSEFVDRPGGIRREIVKEYASRGGGTVIPSAPDDTRGGREDLVGPLPPPIDDPSFDDILRLSRRSPEEASEAAIWNKHISPTKAPALAPPPPGHPLAATPVPPLPTQLPTTMQNNGAKQAAALAKEQPMTHTKLPPVELRVPEDPAHEARFAKIDQTLAAILGHINRQAMSDMDSEKEPAEPKEAPERGRDYQKPDKPSWIQVVFEGTFGRFRSKARDVKFCDTHVTLLYTGEAGDEDLAFEPPMDQPFLVKIPMEDRSYRDFSVAHFGLITRLEEFDMTIVVFPFASPPKEEGAEDGAPEGLLSG